MSFYMNMGAGVLNEGEQAEEYLKKKQDAIDKQKSDDEKRYGSNYEKYDYYDEKRYQSGNKSQNTRIDYNGNKRDYSNQPLYRDKSQNNPSDNNPRFDSARDIKEHRKRYPDAVPQSKTKIEKEYDKAKNKDAKAKEYADRVASKYLTREKKAVGGGKYDLENPTYAKAADAARRHYRRTHKHECGIFAEACFIGE